jgi:hypothetical protein
MVLSASMTKDTLFGGDGSVVLNKRLSFFFCFENSAKYVKIL